LPKFKFWPKIDLLEKKIGDMHSTRLDKLVHECDNLKLTKNLFYAQKPDFPAKKHPNTLVPLVKMFRRK